MIYTFWGMGDIDTLRLYQFFPLVKLQLGLQEIIGIGL